MTHDSCYAGANYFSPLANQRNRDSIRLQGYDYSRIGVYFVIICTYNRTCLFWEVANGEMGLNEREILCANVGIIFQSISHM